MNDAVDISGYPYIDAENSCAHAYLLPVVRAELARLRLEAKRQAGARRCLTDRCYVLPGNRMSRASPTKDSRRIVIQLMSSSHGFMPWRAELG